MQAFVVAIEYAGADIGAREQVPRVPVLEHAYDLKSAALAAHDGHPPRYAFPASVRGWPTPPSCPRCPDCEHAVDDIVVSIVAFYLHGLPGLTARPQFT